MTLSNGLPPGIKPLPNGALPPGVVLSPIETPVAGRGASTSPGSRKPGRTHARHSRSHSKRFASFNVFVDSVMRTLTPKVAHVWVVLWRDTKPDGLARTGVADLARRAGCNESTVKRALRLLVERGLLEVVRRGGLGRGVSTYKVK